MITGMVMVASRLQCQRAGRWGWGKWLQPYSFRARPQVTLQQCVHTIITRSFYHCESAKYEDSCN